MGMWSGVAAAYDASFAQMCAGAVGDLLDAVDPVRDAGERLLDLGTGTGGAAVAAEARGWLVDAVDPEPDMLALAARRPSAVRWRAAAGADLPFDTGVFDAAVANFAVNHADRPGQVVAELRRVTRPGGLLAVTVWPWQPTALNRLWADLMDETDTRPPAGVPLPVDSGFARTEEGVSGLLRDGGWTPVDARRLAWEWEIPPAPLWRGVEAGLATVGQGFRQACDAGRTRLRAAWASRVGGQDLLRFPVEAVLVSARR